MLYSKLALLTTLISVAVSIPQSTTIEADRAFLQNGEKNTFIEENKMMEVDIKDKNVIEESLGDRIAEMEVKDALLHHRHDPHGFKLIDEEVVVGDNGLVEDRLREEDQIRLIEDLARLDEGGDKISIKND